MSLKDSLGYLEKLENVTISTFTLELLFKIINFKMKNNITNFKADKFKFNFKIEGSLDKNKIGKEISLEEDFELAEVNDTKVKCVFSLKEDGNGDLSCNFNANNHKKIKTFSFKISEIKVDDNDIYFVNLNDIELINTEENNLKKILIIVGSIVGGVVVATSIGIVVYCIKKKKKLQLANERYNTQNVRRKKMTNRNPTSPFEQNAENQTSKRKIERKKGKSENKKGKTKKKK